MKKSMWLVRPVAIAVSSCFGIAPLWANPTGPQVMSGTANIQGLGTNNLKVTNSPSAIIHWQGFSIGAGQVTNFVQQSASSAVLNRVVGADISQIHGQLLSNGRVFLINPAGIIIGAGGVINTAGFVGSSLQMQDGDFLAGKLRFQGDASSGSIVNNGWIRAGSGGNIVLVAPNIQNNGLIQTEGGQLVLAAGQKMTIGSLELEGVQFEIQAPADSVLNVGKLLADGGAVGVFAGTLKHSGDIRAGALARDEAGRVVLKAQGDITIAGGSTINASGKSGGDILVQSGRGHTRVAGQIAAEGSAGRGGDIKVLGDRVSLVDNALVNASGALGGGQIRIGGDYQGANASIANASRTFVGPSVALRADAHDAGEGGRIIIWADKSTQYYGSLSARGGVAGGNGGFAEVSGKQDLVFLGRVDLGAPGGLAGNLLLDPLDLYVDDRGGAYSPIIDENTDVPGNAVTVSPATLASLNANVKLFASRYMRISSDVTLNPGHSFSVEVGTYTPLVFATGINEGSQPNQLDLAANITTTGGAINLLAPRIQTVANSTLSSGGGAINLTAASPSVNIGRDIAAGALTLAAAGGAVQVTADNGFISLGAVSGASFTASAGAGSLSTRGITTGGGPVAVNATGFVSLATSFGDAIQTFGGAVTVNSTSSNVQTGGILAGGGPVDIEGNNVNTSTIETTGAVNLRARAGQVSARVNNAASVTASSRHSGRFNQARVAIDSTGTLNATSISAIADPSTCDGFGCPTAAILLSSSGGNVNVGTVTASAPVFAPGTFAESITESVSITTTGLGNSVLAMPGSQVKATDVTLGTEALSGGMIGGATPLNVDVRRTLTFNPNGAFNVALNGASGPNRLISSIGRMPTGGFYNDSTLLGNGVNLQVDATDSIVTVDNLLIAANAGGFSSVVNRTSPLLSLVVPNGALHVKTISVPAGGVPQGATPEISGALPVTLRAEGPDANHNLTLESYTRTGTANPSTLTLSSTNGMVTLGTLAAANDAITVNAAGDVVFSTGGSLTTGGSVAMTSTNGSFLVGLIDTSSGGAGSSVSLIASCAAAIGGCGPTGGNVFALNDLPGLEISSAGDVTIDARVIGNQAPATNPFAITAATDRLVTLSSRSAGGRIGVSTAAPVVVNANRLAINAPDAAPFDVNTGSIDLKDLSVTLQPAGVSTVTSNGKQYQFESGGGGLELTVDAASNTQFADGLFSVTVPTGDINVLTPIDLGATGSLVLDAKHGSIDAASQNLSAKNITLTAGNDTNPDTPAPPGTSTLTFGSIGSGGFRPDTVNITAGHDSGAGRTGTVESGGTIFGKAINITTFGRSTSGISMQFGGNSEDQIGGPAAGQHATTVTLDARPLASQSGSIGVGSIFADQSISIRAQSTINVNNGSLESPTIFVGGPAASPLLRPAVTVAGPLGSVIPVHNVEVRAASVNITGPITGDGAANGSLLMSTSAGALTVGGAITGFGNTSTIDLGSTGGVLNLGPAGTGVITAGDGSTITLSHGPATPSAFGFATLDAGATGSVTINTNGNNISQQTGGTGITARSVVLNSGAGSILHSNAAAPNDSALDLNGAKNLTLVANGRVRLDLNNSTLDAFSLTKANDFDATSVTLTGLGAGQVIAFSDAGGGSADITVDSPLAAGPLDFTFNHTGAAAVTSSTAGIITSGGSVNINTAGPLSAAGGIDTTGPSADGRGHVTLISSGGSITTGAITTSPTALKPADADPARPARTIDITTDCAAATVCDIIVSGDLNTGVNGGPIVLRVLQDGSVTRANAAVIKSESPNSVTIFVNNGNIGSAGAGALDIDSPHTSLTANNTGPVGGSLTAGNVFATVRNTTASSTIDLDLIADNGFDVATQVKPLSALSIATRGTGTGALNLTAPGQSYVFNRIVTDLFTGAPLADTFQVADATGTPTLTSATFRAIDGDLLVKGTPGGIAPINAANLTLASDVGDVKLQGNAGNPLVLTNTTQTFSAVRDLSIVGRADITGGTQTFSATNGNITFAGGNANNEALIVSASTRQYISTPTTGAGTGSILLTAGAANNSLVRLAFTGNAAHADIEQQIEARGNVELKGGAAGTGSLAEITTGSQRQLVRADGDLVLTGGDGASAPARIVNTGTGHQQVGESRGSPTSEPYQTNQVRLQGGIGASSHVEILASGSQDVFSAFDTVSVIGGTGDQSFAQIKALGTGTQQIGNVTRPTGTLTVQGGTGPGAFALIGAANAFQLVRSGDINVTGTNTSATISAANQNISGNTTILMGGSATNAEARIAATGNQTLAFGDLTLQAGGNATTAVANAGAIIQGMNQSKFGQQGTITLNGGAGTAGNSSDAVIRNLAGNQDFRGNRIVILGGLHDSTTGIFNLGTGSQNIVADDTGGISLTGRATGAGADVRIHNTAATSQSVNASRFDGPLALANNGIGIVDIRSEGSQSITGNGGVSVATSGGTSSLSAQTSQTINSNNGLVSVASNSGSNASIAAQTTQTFTAAGGVSVTSTASGNATISTPGAQTFTSSNGGISATASSTGNASITTDATQRVTSAFLAITTGLGSTGNATVAATGNQWIRTTNGALAPGGGPSIRVAGRGTGVASLQSGARQLLEVDYRETMQSTPPAAPPGSVVVGAADAMGTSLIQAVNQMIFGRAITVQGGAAAGTGSKASGPSTHITGTNIQEISLVDGSLSVLGGSGVNSVATIDPVTQTVVANGGINVTGGSASGATASIEGTTQILIATKGDIAVTGGSAPGAAGSVVGATQTLNAGSNISVSGGSVAGAPGTIQALSDQSISALGTLFVTGGASNAQLINLAGDQNIAAGTMFLMGGPTTTTGIFNQGSGAQFVTSRVDGITLHGDANATSGAVVVIQNVPATLQTITAAGDVSLNSRGAGTVAITSAGTQVIEARGLDVLTDASGAGGANATVSAAGDQTIHTRGALAAEPGVGMRVASLSTGTAQVVSGANQVLNIGHPELVQGQLLIGRLTFGPPGLGNSQSGFPAVGDSLVLATNTATPGLANQTVNAGSVYIQGPSGDLHVSKLSADATQNVTTFVGGVSIIGGSGTDSFAMIDPTNQNVTSFGNILLQGGSGPNADALINATGPQTVFSQNGNVTLIGGSGLGADALISTTSPFQSVSGANGLFLQQGPAGGGFAFLQQGSNLAAAQIAANSLTNELLREQDNLDKLRDEALSGDEEDSRLRRRAELCS